MIGFTKAKKRLAAGLAVLLSICMLAGLQAPAIAQAARKGNVYIVEKGDCLYSIGRELAVDWKDIAELNGLHAPYTIYVGQELKLPETAAAGPDDAGKEAADRDETGNKDADRDGAVNGSDQAERPDDEPNEASDGTETGNFDTWTILDLIEGDCYGIYPLSWYEDDMRKPVAREQLELLLNGIGDKLLKIEGTTERYSADPTYAESMTVEDLLNNLFAKLSSYEYKKSLGLEKRYSMIAYMMEYGVYTGENGEPGLEDVCSVQDACVYGTRVIKMAYDALDAGSRGFLWETSHDKNTVYLLGSIHLASTDIYPFSEEMYELFEQSDALVEEVNLYDNAGLIKFSMQAVYNDGTTLKDHVPEEVYKRCMELAPLLGLSEEAASRCKPWYLANSFNTLAAAGGSDITQAQSAAALGIDMHFLTKAYLEEKTVLEAEGYEKQGAVMDSFSPELQQYLLENAIAGLSAAIASETETPDAEEGKASAGESENALENWLSMWHDGDFKGFVDSYGAELKQENAAVFEDAGAEQAALEAEYLNKLITERDKGMAEYVDGLLKDETGNTYFVIVGAGHYVTDSSVLKQLEEMGYQVKTVMQ